MEQEGYGNTGTLPCFSEGPGGSKGAGGSCRFLSITFSPKANESQSTISTVMAGVVL